jgi:glycosyltransferase involved in cell wall biosynthesis
MLVSAIIPAHNEAPRIGAVLDILTTFPGFAEVIVVDDGSSDGTAQVATQYTARVIQIPKMGKDYAMDVGVLSTESPIVFFCDADISGLTHEIIRETIAPIVAGHYDMSIAARRSKIRHVGFGIMFSPLLDGQRAVAKDLWLSVPEHYRRGYEIEVALNHVASRRPRGLTFKHYDITQVHKEEKRGYVSGRWARYAMYRDIALAKARLAVEVP